MKLLRGPVEDWVEEDGEAAVLVGEKVLVLSALATALLRHLHPDRATELTDLAASLAREFGEPPDGSRVDATLRAVEQLADLGLISVVEPETEPGMK